jgi:hypothetical protein
MHNSLYQLELLRRTLFELYLALNECNKALFNVVIIIIIIISGSTVLVRTLAASHGRFLNLFRHSLELLWMSDQAVAKAYTYTGQHTQKDGTNTHATSGIPTHDLSVQAIKAFGSDRAATGTSIPHYAHQQIFTQRMSLLYGRTKEVTYKKCN